MNIKIIDVAEALRLERRRRILGAVKNFAFNMFAYAGGWLVAHWLVGLPL